MEKHMGFNEILYGGDYNPEQWLSRPDILATDIEYLKKAGCNTVTLGMFSWSTLEPEEGVFDFAWMQQTLDDMYANGIHVILATPSGARPRWMAQQYPEVLRVDENRRRNLFGGRHNHCPSSPMYRDKVNIINRQLARHFAGHPAVVLWHVSNEYGGDCHCELCRNKFRVWLRTQYNDIDELNREWWTTFWSHTYRNFDEIESPSPHGENSMQGLRLAWKRFTTDQTVDFMRHEVNSLHSESPHKPVTTNMMYRYDGLNYNKFSEVVDIISWDSYPTWGKTDYAQTATDTAFWHDVMRGIKKKPFLLMESCPSATNWQSVSRLKRPGMLKASSYQAIAHGSDSVLYFQIRQSRGGDEKFHGALIDHCNRDDTRVFCEASALGGELKMLTPIVGANAHSQVAVVYDWENKWAIEGSLGPRNCGMHYDETVLKPYAAFRRLGLDVDVIDMEKEFTNYKIVVAPMLYMLRKGALKNIRAYVEKGGCFVLGPWSGIVDASDLCYLEGTPHGLMDVFGIRREETDALYDDEENGFAPVRDNPLGLNARYRCEKLCDIIKTDGARVLMKYAHDFYKGTPAVTHNHFLAGDAYYVCAEAEQKFWDDFLLALAQKQELPLFTPPMLPAGLEICRRKRGEKEYLFIQNFGKNAAPLPNLPAEACLLVGDISEEKIAPLDTLVYEIR